MGRFLGITYKKGGPVSVLERARIRTLRNVYGDGSPTVGTTSFFSPPAHLCAVIYMNEIWLIVTLNKQFTSPLSSEGANNHIKHVFSDSRSEGSVLMECLMGCVLGIPPPCGRRDLSRENLLCIPSVSQKATKLGGISKLPIRKGGPMLV